MQHRADVGDRRVVEHVTVPVSTSTSTSAKPTTKDVLAVARIVVLGHAHQTLTGERGGRRLRDGVDVARQLVAVVLAAELDRLLRRLCERHARRRRPRHGPSATL